MTQPQPIINVETIYNSFINERLVSALKTISNNPFSLKSMISFGIILLSNEIKSAFLDFIKSLRNIAPSIADYLMDYCKRTTYVIWFICMKLLRKPTRQITEPQVLAPQPTRKTITMSVEFTPEYMECLIGFTKMSPCASFTPDDDIKLKMDSLRSGKLEQSLNNVKYKILCQKDEIEIVVDESLSLNCVPQEIADIKKIIKLLADLGISGQNPLAPLISMDTINKFWGFGTHLRTNRISKCIDYLKRHDIYDSMIKIISEMIECPTHKHKEALMLLLIHLGTICISANNNGYLTYRINSLLNIEICVGAAYVPLASLVFDKKYLKNRTALITITPKARYNNELDYIVHTDPMTGIQTVSSHILNLRISSPIEVENAIVVQTVKNFFETDISSGIASLNRGAAIKISELSIENEEKEEEHENPAYKDWLRLSSADSTAEHVSTATMMKLRPEQMTKIKKVIKIVSTKTIGESKKPIQTLYLPSGLQSILLKQLGKFRDEVELYEQLGIPHKFGLLLHGPPGTGKSTTIKAIASFLGRDIYYINLRGIRTNKELKMLFDHVHTMTTGGLIVFEDIDVMTPIVLRRREARQIENTCELMSTEEDSLTLSYLLNLLDGPLCKENTVFAMTTNDIESLDPALYREGRIDFTIKLDNCDRAQFCAIVESLLRIRIPEVIVSRLEILKHSPAAVIQRVFRYVGAETIELETILEPYLDTIHV